MNKITLIGNLVHDPEVSTTPNGISVCRFTLAVNRRFSKGEDRQTDYFRVITWRGLADNCARYLSKGSKAAVVGEMQLNKYQTKDGETRYSADVAADEVEFLSKAQANSSESPSSSEQTAGDGFVDVSNDTLPF